MFVRLKARAVVGTVVAAVALVLAAPAVASAGVPWPYPVLTPTPTHAVPHDWDGCVSAPPFSCGSVPVGTYSELGGVELDVLRSIGEPHWTANVGPLNDQYTTQLGSDESSGSPGDWDIYAYIYHVQPLSYG